MNHSDGKLNKIENKQQIETNLKISSNIHSWKANTYHATFKRIYFCIEIDLSSLWQAYDTISFEARLIMAKGNRKLKTTFKIFQWNGTAFKAYFEWKSLAYFQINTLSCYQMKFKTDTVINRVSNWISIVSRWRFMNSEHRKLNEYSMEKLSFHGIKKIWNRWKIASFN